MQELEVGVTINSKQDKHPRCKQFSHTFTFAVSMGLTDFVSCNAYHVHDCNTPSTKDGNNLHASILALSQIPQLKNDVPVRSDHAGILPKDQGLVTLDGEGDCKHADNTHAYPKDEFREWTVPSFHD